MSNVTDFLRIIAPVDLKAGDVLMFNPSTGETEHIPASAARFIRGYKAPKAQPALGVAPRPVQAKLDLAGEKKAPKVRADRIITATRVVEALDSCSKPITIAELCQLLDLNETQLTTVVLELVRTKQIIRGGDIRDVTRSTKHGVFEQRRLVFVYTSIKNFHLLKPEQLLGDTYRPQQPAVAAAAE